jgi:hypothetical protein
VVTSIFEHKSNLEVSMSDEENTLPDLPAGYDPYYAGPNEDGTYSVVALIQVRVTDPVGLRAAYVMDVETTDAEPFPHDMGVDSAIARRVAESWINRSNGLGEGLEPGAIQVLAKGATFAYSPPTDTP